jgi:HD superfamily phosphodiesterase/ribosomal protein S27E
MSKTKCPGQNTMFWGPEDIFEVTCSNCGNAVEFFKDDASRACRSCGKRIQNPKLSLGCAQWCEYAEDCLGFDPKTQKPGDSNEEALVDMLVEAAAEEFGSDRKRFAHALEVLEYARRILRSEPGDPRVVLSAAVLNDAGVRVADMKRVSSSGEYREPEGPTAGKRILEKIGMDELTISRVCRIIVDHHAGCDADARESKILRDADLLANYPEEFAGAEKNLTDRELDKIFKTKTGREIARELYGRKKEKSSSQSA